MIGETDSCPCSLPVHPNLVDCAECGRFQLSRNRVRACMLSRSPTAPIRQPAPAQTDSPITFRRFDWAADLPCVHRGGSLLTLLCGCGGGTAVPLYPCGLGGDCIVVYVPVSRTHPQLARDLKVCDTCPHRIASGPDQPSSPAG